jgi:hypothetical protein
MFVMRKRRDIKPAKTRAAGLPAISRIRAAAISA